MFLFPIEVNAEANLPVAALLILNVMMANTANEITNSVVERELAQISPISVLLNMLLYVAVMVKPMAMLAQLVGTELLSSMMVSVRLLKSLLVLLFFVLLLNVMWETVDSMSLVTLIWLAAHNVALMSVSTALWILVTTTSALLTQAWSVKLTTVVDATVSGVRVNERVMSSVNKKAPTLLLELGMP